MSRALSSAWLIGKSDCGRRIVARDKVLALPSVGLTPTATRWRKLFFEAAGYKVDTCWRTRPDRRRGRPQAALSYLLQLLGC